jgi:hypothetical protein
MALAGILLIAAIGLTNAYLTVLVIAIVRAEKKERFEREVQWIVNRFRNGVVL